MPVIVRIPTTLRPLTGGASEVSVEGATVGAALADLESRHPGFEERLLDDDGALLRFVNVFVDALEARALQGLDTAVDSDTVISIVPAVAGGYLQH